MSSERTWFDWRTDTIERVTFAFGGQTPTHPAVHRRPKLKGWASTWMSHDGFHEKIGSETPAFGVAQVVGFGLGRSKMLYLSMGIDCLPLRQSRTANAASSRFYTRNGNFDPLGQGAEMVATVAPAFDSRPFAGRGCELAPQVERERFR
jgi:hypothetical protein